MFMTVPGRVVNELIATWCPSMLGSEGELKHVTEGMTQSLIYISTGFRLRVVDTSVKKPLRYKKYSNF